MEIMEQKMQEQIEGAIMKDSAGVCETCNGDGYLVEVYTHPECCGNSETGECGSSGCNGPQPVEEPTQVECRDCYGTGAKTDFLDKIKKIALEQKHSYEAAVAIPPRGLWCKDDYAVRVDHDQILQIIENITELREKVENLEAFAQFIIDGYANHDLNHVDFRVGAYKNDLHALDQEAPEEKMARDLGLLPELERKL